MSVIAVVAAAVHLAAAGPAIAGSSVVWGEQNANGSLSVMARSGGHVRELRRISAGRDPAGKLRFRSRSFSGVPGGLSASRRWVVYGLDDGVCESNGSDAVGCELKMRVFGSRDGGSFRPLVPQCDSAAYASTASEGDRVAIGLDDADCDGRVATRVYLKEGKRPPRLLFEGRRATVIDVELAGRWVAWGTGPGGGAGDTAIVIADRQTGAVVERLPATLFGGTSIDGFAIDRDRNVAALAWRPGSRCDYVCLSVRRAGEVTARRLSRHAVSRAVALAAGRIAYVNVRDGLPRHVIVRRLDGSHRQIFDRFTRRHVVHGEVALSRGRVVWATQEDPNAEAKQRGDVHSAPLRNR